MFMRSPILSSPTVDYLRPLLQILSIYRFLNSLESPWVWFSPSQLVCSELVLKAIHSYVLPSSLHIDTTTPLCNLFSEQWCPVCVNFLMFECPNLVPTFLRIKCII
jgi:hypothetical protein